MPLYAGIDGAQKELFAVYAGVSGTAKQLDMVYGGVGGAAKELLSSGYSWKKYTISTVPLLVYGGTLNGADVNCSTSKQTSVLYATNVNQLIYESGGYALFTDAKCSRYNVAEDVSYHSELVGKYIPITDSGVVATIYHYGTDIGSLSTSQTRVMLATVAANGRMNGDIYTVAPQKGDYIENVKSANIDAYPINGEQDGYWYVFDGDITWNKYVLNEIYEPSAYDSEESFSSSQSYPLLMASQAKKDGNGNADWGTTYSASSASNLRSNYSTYPFCSFASTLNADNLYKITTASIFSYKRQKVSAWSVTSQSAGNLIGSVTGKYGDYPEDGIQDGFWYIMQEIV